MVRCKHARLHHPRAPFEVAARAEQRHHRRLHGGGDVHRHRIHADETFGLRRERRELLERKPAGEVHRGLAQLRQDAADVLAFSLVRGGGQDHAQALVVQAVDEVGAFVRVPAFEQPARGWVKMNVAARHKIVRTQQVAHGILRLGPCVQHQPALVQTRLQTQTPQRVEVDLDGVARLGRHAIAMTEGGVPGFATARRVVAHHRKFRSEQVREPGAARGFREVQQQVVVLRTQRTQQPDLPRADA